jgi:hypothetical protein
MIKIPKSETMKPTIWAKKKGSVTEFNRIIHVNRWKQLTTFDGFADFVVSTSVFGASGFTAAIPVSASGLAQSPIPR